MTVRHGQIRPFSAMLSSSAGAWRCRGMTQYAASFLMKPEDPQLSLMRLIGQNAIVTPRQVRRTSPPRSDATCFHTLLAGSGHLQVGTLQCG